MPSKQFTPLIGDCKWEVWHAHCTQCLCITLTRPDEKSVWAMKFYHPRRISGRIRWTPGMGPDFTPIVSQEGA
jgi:hypothetical protein